MELTINSCDRTQWWNPMCVIGCIFPHPGANRLYSELNESPTSSHIPNDEDVQEMV